MRKNAKFKGSVLWENENPNFEKAITSDEIFIIVPC